METLKLRAKAPTVEAYLWQGRFEDLARFDEIVDEECLMTADGTLYLENYGEGGESVTARPGEYIIRLPGAGWRRMTYAELMEKFEENRDERR